MKQPDTVFSVPVSIWQRRYAQCFIATLLAASLAVMFVSLHDGPNQFQTSFMNRIGLISAFTQLRLWLGDRVYNKVLVGNDGWLLYSNSENMDDYQNTFVSTNDNQKETYLKIIALANKLAAEGKTLLVVVPNKHTIYPEILPPEIQKIGPYSQLDSLMSNFDLQTTPLILDLRPALLEAREQQDVFYKTDSHWNAYGAYAGYRAVMLALAQTYPALTPFTITEYQISSQPASMYDLSRLLTVDYLAEPRTTVAGDFDLAPAVNIQQDNGVAITMTSQANTALPHLLMFGDSFTDGLRPFLSPHFSIATYVQAYGLRIDMNLIEQFDPDIVIIEVVERQLPIFATLFPIN